MGSAAHLREEDIYLPGSRQQPSGDKFNSSRVDLCVCVITQGSGVIHLEGVCTWTPGVGVCTHACLAHRPLRAVTPVGGCGYVCSRVQLQSCVHTPAHLPVCAHTHAHLLACAPFTLSLLNPQDTLSGTLVKRAGAKWPEEM